MKFPAGMLLLVVGPVLAAADYDSHVEAHGFVSFGHLKSWGNNWLGPTRDGSNEFWEGALNATARPMDRLRLGAQIYARDLGGYDNGKAQLDLLYADYRFTDALGIQAGRFKLPVGLFNESLDVDASRTSIFQPPYVYALRSRDLFISTDGLKVYGTADPIEYAGFFGNKHLDPQGGVTTLFRQTSAPVEIDHLQTAWIAGGMLHWHTPVPGLGTRVTLTDLHDFHLVGELPAAKATTSTRFDHYLYAVASVIYETDGFTWVGEYTRSRARGETTANPAVFAASPAEVESEAGYLSGTWHARRWLELYTALEYATDDAKERSASSVTTTVFAVCTYPLANWSVKAEIRDNHGRKGAFAVDNSNGVEARWQVLALKTTVDF